ncbi:hypothetical protein B0H17DRAFT_1126641 [Mycena rosella]|uniref:Uncharacterized protein n=1 Tax=Mycena rosella TaxID=1033263 RepID=A0AAD7GTI6_MYCRO|nr:hypothetical protein B0H17DRAFT_1126641 [Mycena rosella]
MEATPTKTPLASQPTLHIVPSFSGLLAVPAVAQAALASILGSAASAPVTASASAADASSVTNVLLSSASTATEEGEEFGLNGLFDSDDTSPLESAAGPTPSASTPTANATSSTVKPKSSAKPKEKGRAQDAESSSSSIHPLYKAAGFQPGEIKIPTKFSKADHQGVRDNLDALLSATASIDDRVWRLQGDIGDMGTCTWLNYHSRECALTPPVFSGRFAEVFEAVDARGADALSEQDLSAIAERVANHGDATVGSLVIANNQHVANFGEVAQAVRNLNRRVQGIESAAVLQINALATLVGVLQSTVNALRVTVETLATQASAATTAPPPAASAPAPPALAQPLPPTITDVDAEQTKLLFLRFLAASGKRARDEDLDTSLRSVRPRTESAQLALVTPPTFVYTSTAQPTAFGTTTTAPPALAAAPFAPAAAPFAPAAAPFALAAAPQAPPPALTTPPFMQQWAPSMAAPPLAPAAPSAAPPAAPTAPPAAPAAPPATAAGPPQAPHDPRRDVVFGAVTWTRDPNGRPTIKADVANILKVVIPSSKGVRFRNRRANDDAYTILTFDTPEIAAWIVATWAQVHRGVYHAVMALHPNA